MAHDVQQGILAGIALSSWLVHILEVARERRMCCSRACSVSVKPCLPSVSSVRPTSLPGSCPKCGMSLQQVDASEVYACPMHADVMSRSPGACPKCGMTLVKKETEE